MSFGCQSWYVEVPDGSRQKYSSNIESNGLFFTWHVAATTTSFESGSDDVPYQQSHGGVGVISLNVQGEEETAGGEAWRIAASDESGTDRRAWYADDTGGTNYVISEASRGPTVDTVVIVMFSVPVAVCFLALCLLVRRTASAPTEVFNFQDPERGQGSAHAPQNMQRTSSKESTVSTDTGDSSSTQSYLGTSGSSGAGAASAKWYEPPRGWQKYYRTKTGKEPKVHPEPDPPEASRSSRGAWRTEGAFAAASRSQAHSPDSSVGRSPSRKAPKPSASGSPEARKAAEKEARNASDWSRKVDEKHAEVEKERREQELRKEKQRARQAAEAAQQQRAASEAEAQRRAAEDAERRRQQEQQQQEAQSRPRRSTSAPPSSSGSRSPDSGPGGWMPR